MELKNKVAVITGISKGIGRALSEQLLEKGCKVAGFGRTEPDYEHPNLYFYKTDVRDHNQVHESFVKAVLDLGNDIHILINNAGLGYFGFIENYSLEQWDEMFQTNVNGIFYTCRKVVPLMKKTGFGHIFNISSTAGLEGYPQVTGYCGTKFAVKGISEGLYKELRDFKIKVTCVYPGSVKTDFFRNSPNIDPHDYMLQPEDVATMIVQALEMPDNFHQVNLEIRPLQPKGPPKI